MQRLFPLRSFFFFFYSSPTTRQTFFDGVRWKNCEVRRAESGANHHSGGDWILSAVQRSTDPGFKSHPKSFGPSSEHETHEHKEPSCDTSRPDGLSVVVKDDLLVVWMMSKGKKNLPWAHTSGVELQRDGIWMWGWTLAVQSSECPSA